MVTKWTQDTIVSLDALSVMTATLLPMGTRTSSWGKWQCNLSCQIKIQPPLARRFEEKNKAESQKMKSYVLAT